MPKSQAERMDDRLCSARNRILQQVLTEFDDEFINRIVIPGFTPTPAMIAYAKAYVCSSPNDSFTQIAQAAGIPEVTLRSWRKRPGFKDWIARLMLASIGTALPLVWQATIQRAVAGDMRAVTLIANRFDPEYQARHGKAGAPMRGGAPTDGELEATRATLRTSQDGPLDVVADGSATPAGEAPQAPAPPSTGDEEKGAGGE